MPELFKKNIGLNSLLAVWQITETTNELLKLLNGPVNFIVLDVNEQLKQQRICARILLNLLLEGPRNEIMYDRFNKPSLIHSASKISISHAHDYVAVIVNKINETGIDIELIKSKIERIAPRFMSEKELKGLQSNNRIEQLITYWCAKETLYKYYGKKELSFRENIFIEPFNQSNSGNIVGHINTKHFNIELNLCYEKIADYLLVYVND